MNVVTVPLPALHQTLTHAVADGQAPDLAILDSVWIRRVRRRRLSLCSLEELDEEWVRGECDARLPAMPLVDTNRYDGRTYGVSPFANVAGLWYRRRELEELGCEPPATWAQLRAVARAAARTASPSDRDDGRLEGRRDDGVLPDRVPGLERGQCLAPRG